MREVPGTTRDAIDTTLAWGRSEVVLIDTAGIRRRGKVASGPGRRASSRRSARCRAIARADVAILVIDAVEGLTAQDAHVAGYVVEEGKGLVVAVNKWDLVEEKTDRTFDQYVEWIRNEVAVPRLRAGRLDQRQDRPAGRPRPRGGGRHLGRAPQAHLDRRAQPGPRVGAAERQLAAGRQGPPARSSSTRPRPPSRRRRSCSSRNDAGSVHFSYRRYLENRLREAFGFDGTPIRLVFRERSAVKLPRRKKAGPTGDGRGGSPSAPERHGLGGPAGLSAAPARRREGAAKTREAARSRRRSRRPSRDEARSTGRGSGPPDAVTSGPASRPGDARPGARRGRGRRRVGHDARDPARPARAGQLLVPDRRDARRGSPRRAGTSSACRGSTCPPASRSTADADGGRARPISSSSPCLRPTSASRWASSARRSSPVADVLSVVKGLERGRSLRMSEVIADAGGIDPAPDRAPCRARTSPPRSPAACPRRPSSRADDHDLARAGPGARSARARFRLYVNGDLLGVELCGALKNIIAIAAGAADGLGFGDNGKAGLMTRGLAEMIRLGIAAGANPLTFAGLAGIGDVVATCGSHLSRNHRLGVELAKGRKWAEIEATLPGVAEGAYTVEAAARPGRPPRRRDADRPRGPPRAVRGQERAALPDRPARPRVEGRARRLPAPGSPARPPRPRRVGPRPRVPLTSADPLAACRGVAQPGSAPEWGSGGRAFESLRPDHSPEHERASEGRPRRWTAPSVRLSAGRAARFGKNWTKHRRLVERFPVHVEELDRLGQVARVLTCDDAIAADEHGVLEPRAALHRPVRPFVDEDGARRQRGMH